MWEEGPLADASNLVKGHMAQCMRVRCKDHAKQARYQILYYTEENLLVVKCLNCPPSHEVLRAKIAKDGCPFCLGGDNAAD